MTDTCKIWFAAGQAKVPIVMDIDDQVGVYLRKRLRNSEWPFANYADDEFAAAINHSTGVVGNRQMDTDLPEITYNSLLLPGGAARFGRGLFLIAGEHISDLLSAAWQTSWSGEGNIPQAGNVQAAAVTLNITTARSDFRAKLYLQTPIQLDVTTAQSGDKRQLWLCPFVDARFAKLHHVTDPETLDVKCSAPKSWTQLATEVGSVGPGSVTNVGTVDPAYLYPDPGYFSVARSAGYALDHIAASSGRRVIYDPFAESFKVTAVSNAETDLDTYIGNMRQAGFPVLLGEPGGNPAAPDPQEYSFSVRNLYDHYDNNSWTKRDDTTGGASGETGMPHVISTFYLEQNDSGSEQRATALTDILCQGFRKWQQKQFCVTYADAPIGGSLLESGFTDYTFIKIDGTTDQPRLATTHQSYKTGVIPNLNISQSASFYRHPQELARITLTGSGIPQGATSGQGTIQELDTKYDGSSGTVTVTLLGPASQAIPAGTVLNCYFQSNTGWFAIQGEPGPPGAGGSQWIQFRVKSQVGQAGSGIWQCVVLQHRNTTGITCGDIVQVHDPANMFPDVVGEDEYTITACLPAEGDFEFTNGSIGTAYWREPSTSCNDPEDVSRWEVETCTQVLDAIEVQLKDDCMILKPNEVNPTYTAYVNEADVANTAATSPNRDFPPEFVDEPDPSNPNCWNVSFQNPYSLTAIAGSRIFIRRAGLKDTSISGNTTTPHNYGTHTSFWYVEHVVEQVQQGQGWIGRYAKWAMFTKVQSQGNFQDLDGNTYNLTYYWDGANPQQGNDVDAPCRPRISCTVGSDGCECIDDGDLVLATYAPEYHTYFIISTKSAFLGAPTTHTLMKNLTPRAAGDCGYDQTKQSFKMFTCDSDPVVTQLIPNTVSVDVVTSGNVTGTDLCLTKSTLQVCSYSPGTSTDCYDLCVCAPCSASNCIYSYNQETGYWVAALTCPEECECSGEMPTHTPAPGDPTTITYPCRDPNPPVNSCMTCEGCTYGDTDCTNYGYKLNGPPVVDAVNNNNEQIHLNTLASIITRTSSCEWEITGLLWENQATGQTTAATVTVTQQTLGSTNPSCTPYVFMNLSWSPASVYGITPPVEMNGSSGICAPMVYGQSGGCGVMPPNPSSNGYWNGTYLATTCCEQGEVESANDQAYIDLAKSEIVAGASFNNATFSAALPASEQPKTVGEAFKAAYPQYFRSCKCTNDVLPVMNRWETKKQEPTLAQATKIANLLYKKLGHADQNAITVEQIAQQIIDFTKQFYGV